MRLSVRDGTHTRKEYGLEKKSIFSRRWVRGSAVLATAALSLALTAPAQAAPLTGVESAAVNAENNYVVDVNFAGGIKGKIAFLEDGIFRYNVDPSGEFDEYAVPRSKDHVARIQAQPDTSDEYSHPKATVADKDGAFVISAGDTTISLDKKTAKMTVKSGDKVVLEEQAALDLSESSTVQSLVKHSGENFFGGGTQNGRFIHTGNTINIANESSWTDGGVSSPNPFYWSDAGYGVLRNTFQDGSYDFGKTTDGVTTATHNENELDAYYFVADAASGKSTAPIAQDLLQDYFKVTGNPVLLPEYAFYVGHLNAWNRDMWSDTAQAGYNNKWQIKGGEDSKDANAGDIEYEKGGTGTEMQANTTVETLNGTGPTVATDNIPEGVTYDKDFSAQGRLNNYLENDMPLGYFLPNDGYGAGYGQNGYKMTGGVNEDGSSSKERLAAVDANIANLKTFSDYASSKGVATGLWTQSQLTPDSDPNTQWQLLRDFKKEVEVGGVTTLKTDVAWVGPGYSFALNGTKTAYDIATNPENKTATRPNIITLDGWAGTQRYAGIWTGDQSGGNWEYIRFHVPTYIGQSLSGNPNIGSDNDGIWGGNPVIATRDYQWKSFAPLMLDMDGWGSYVKAPQTHGDPYTGITRMYLKLKSSLMPYIYTTAASAANLDTGNGDEGLPIVRAILLSDDSDYAASTATQYEYTLGEDILVAPIVANTDGDASNNGVGDGNDIRNGIYLPGDENTIWVDYFTGKQYRGGQVLNNFDAPLWKLPVFVKANAIIPMYEPNNNPADIDRSIRNVEFFATNGENSYTQYEDDGVFIDSELDTSDAAYGTENDVNYGGHVSTKYTSKVNGDKATFTAEKSTGGYTGYVKDRTTSFVVNASKEPASVVAKNGDTTLKQKKVTSQEEFDKATPAEGEFIYFYNTKPNMNYNASSAATDAVKKEGFSSEEIITTPKLYVKFAKADVQANKQTLEITGFENKGETPSDTVIDSLKVPVLKQPSEEAGDLTPTSFRLSWDKVDGASSYELMIDGMLNSIPAGTPEEPNTTLNVLDQAYHSTHTVQIRQRTAEGVSKWSDEITVVTLEDPWRNVPTPVDVTWEGEIYGNHGTDLAFDHQYQSGDGGFHSDGNSIGQKMTIDYGQAYKFTTFEYHPRSDSGNGTVTKMRIETSLDGVHWTSQEVDWQRSADTKVVNLNTSARYVRLTPLSSVGNFFSASELVLNKVDESSSFEVGSIAGDGKVNDVDYQHLVGNCLGRENRAPLDTDWSSHIAPNAADFNYNEAYDVWDMAQTMFRIDGGTKKTDKLSGNIAVVPSKTSVKAGETITVDLYADDIKNANALGALIHFNDKQFEFVNDSLTKSPYTGSMEDLSEVTTKFKDGIQSANIALVNKGDKDLFNGSGAVASFKLKAKTDIENVALESTAWAIGPTFDVVEVADDGSIEYPDVPKPEAGELGQDAFNIKLTNKALPTDENGTNVSELVQQKNYDGLFNNNTTDRSFEFKYFFDADSFDKRVGLPATLSFELKEPRPLTNVELFNGAKASNGSINSLEAVVTFEDGTKQEFKGGDFSTNQEKYTFQISDENKGKKVTKVEIKPLTSTGVATGLEDPNNRMLTIGEINFNYQESEVAVDSVVLGDNAKTLHVGELSEVKASIKPETVNYPYFKVTSSDPEVASIVTKQVGDKIVNFVRANKAGKATITVASALDETKTASYEVEVTDAVNTAPLEEALAEARTYSADAYTAETFEKLTAAIKAGEDLLKSGELTDQKVAEATVAIRDAIKGLEQRPVDESKLINKDKNSGVTVLKANSFAAESPYTNALDYDESTLWHSNYNDQDVLPDYLIFDLGDTYDLTDVSFLPRQDGATNGDIFEAKIYVANSAEELDGDGKGSLVGTFTFDNNGKVLNNRDEYKNMAFGAQATRFVKIEATRSGGDKADAYASIAETRFYGQKHTDQDQADKSKLDALVADIEAKGLKAEDYTAATWKKFELALGDAKATLADPQATQAEVDSQLAALQSAYEGLEKTEVPPVENPDRDQLQSLIDKAEKLDTTGKTNESVQALVDAIDAAKAVLANEDATPEQIKAAYDALAAAIDGLTDAGNGGQNGSSGQNGGDNGQGGKPGSGSNSGSGELPHTGDAATVAVAATGVVGSLTAAIGAFLHRRRK